jgi:hypothetical protein
MNVPPYIPPQIEISGNVAEERYAVRVGFVKRVTVLHAASVGIILALSMLPIPEISFRWGLVGTAFSLLGLSFVRGIAKRWRHEQRLSSFFVPIMILSLAVLVRSVTMDAGWPLWAIGLPALGNLIYVALCGRDLSFTGMFVLVSTGISGFVLLMSWLEPGQQPYTLLWLAMVSYTAFYTYDLAALQTRRRLGQEVGAVLDLYRDTLNFITYPIRVINHWRAHRIWSLR